MLPLSSSRSGPPLGLQNRTKDIGATDDIPSCRVSPIRDTLTEITPKCKRIGLTRISNITYMDRLYLPNFSAVLPGTEDLFWVYNGKGITKSYAKASALMETIERYSSLSGSFPRTFIQGSYSDLSSSYNKVLHPDEIVEPVSIQYNQKNVITDFLPGFDLLNDEEVLVPAEVALYRYSPRYPALSVFSNTHTNGLASGNVLEEAICHALCEVIERDAVSIADLCASSIPYNILERVRDSLRGYKSEYSLILDSHENKFVDDSTVFPDVDISEALAEFESIKYLVNRFNDNGIPLLIKDITQKDTGIPTFVASSVESITADYGYFAKGYGTHPDARIALVRAITEVGQTRAANIHGARDDLKKIEYKQNDDLYKRKWHFIPASSPLFVRNSNKNIINFSDVRTTVRRDILDDIHIILNGLRAAGLKRAIIVDLTIPNVGIPVVRAIVPGLETFEVTQSIMGNRAREYYRRLLTN
jgi:thioglycine synthase